MFVGFMSEKKVNSSVKTKKEKKPELINLDPMVIHVATELFAKISPLLPEISQHNNRNTLILTEQELNSSLNIGLKLGDFKEVKKLDFRLRENDQLEINLELERYSSSAKVQKILKIENVLLNSQQAFFSFSGENENNRNTEIVKKIISLLVHYLFKKIFLADFLKNLAGEKIISEKNLIINDLKNGLLQNIYHKTVNQIFNTKVPYFGEKKITDLFEIEGVMSEEGQLWVHLIYKII